MRLYSDSRGNERKRFSCQFEWIFKLLNDNKDNCRHISIKNKYLFTSSIDKSKRNFIFKNF